MNKNLAFRCRCCLKRDYGPLLFHLRLGRLLEKPPKTPGNEEQYEEGRDDDVNDILESFLVLLEQDQDVAFTFPYFLPHVIGPGTGTLLETRIRHVVECSCKRGSRDATKVGVRGVSVQLEGTNMKAGRSWRSGIQTIKNAYRYHGKAGARVRDDLFLLVMVAAL